MPSRAPPASRCFKFDVSDAKACEDGVKMVEAEVGPVDVLVNNAGITRDGMFHRMTYEQWSSVIKTNLDSAFTCNPAGDRRHALAQLRAHHPDFLDQRPEGPDGPDQLLGRQGRRDRLRPGVGAGKMPTRA